MVTTVGFRRHGTIASLLVEHVNLRARDPDENRGSVFFHSRRLVFVKLVGAIAGDAVVGNHLHDEVGRTTQALLTEPV